jgi:hypothetical protein
MKRQVRGVFWCLAPLLIAAAFFVAPAEGQLLHLDPLPFFASIDSTSRLALVVDLDRFEDQKFDWSLNRVLLTAVLPAGETGIYFLRLSHVSFDTGDTPVGSRWPWLLGPESQAGWPSEKRVSSFGKFEVGASGPLKLPLIRRASYCAALGLPTGSDRIYPYSAQSIPFRIQLRKPLPVGDGYLAHLRAGYLVHMDSGQEYLTPDAFPSGYQLGAAFGGHGARGRRWALSWDYRLEGGRESQLVGLQGWLPWTADGAVGLKVSRELAGTLDRPAAWYFTVSWRLESARYRPGYVQPTAAGK